MAIGSLMESYIRAMIRGRTIKANKLYSKTVFWSSGLNSPENVITAPVGSLYSRTNGGANTTLYVKESGTGNTGWSAL